MIDAKGGRGEQKPLSLCLPASVGKGRDENVQPSSALINGSASSGTH